MIGEDFITKLLRRRKEREGSGLFQAIEKAMFKIISLGQYTPRKSPVVREERNQLSKDIYSYLIYGNREIGEALLKKLASKIREKITLQSWDLLTVPPNGRTKQDTKKVEAQEGAKILAKELEIPFSTCLEREEAAIRCTKDLKDKKVILYDDLVRTGVTLRKSIEALLEKGAKDVQPCVLAVGMNIEKPQIMVEEKCQDFIEALQKNYNKLDLERFRAEGIDYDMEHKTSHWKELFADLWYLGDAGYPRLKAGEKWGEWDLTTLLKYFAAIVDTLRSIYFPIMPEKDGSSYWECYWEAEKYMNSKPPQNEEERKEWDRKREEIIKIEKQIEPNWFKLEDMYFPEFVWIPKFLNISGSYIYGQHEPNDLEIILRMNKDGTLSMDDGLTLKIQRIMKRNFGDEIQHLLTSPYGPNWRYLPVYDLVLRPRLPLQIEDVEERDFAAILYKQMRAASPEILSQAKESQKEDKIKMFRMFFPFKTSLDALMAYRLGEKYSVKQVEEYIAKLSQRKKVDFIPFYAQKKYDGNRVIIFKSGKKIKVMSEDGADITNRLPYSEKELAEISSPDQFILDCELERWKGNQHLPREEVAGYLHAGTPADDKEVVINCFDCLFIYDETMKAEGLDFKVGDIHKNPYSLRLKYLEQIPFKQSAIGVPDTSKKLNLSPSLYIDSMAGISPALTKLSKSPASEGAMIKWADSDYPLSGTGTQWLKYKKFAEVHAIVLAKIETKTPGVYNYDVCLSFTEQDKVNKKTIKEIKGKQYTYIGRLYNTLVKVPIGGIVTVRFHTINLYEHPDGTFSLHIYEPNFYEYSPEATQPDNFKQAIAIGEDSGLLERKRIEKAADPFLYNPPEDGTYRYVVQHHWRRKSVHSDLRMEQEDYLIGWTMMDSMEGEVTEEIDTLAKAKEWDAKDIFKIDWKTGQFKERQIRGGVVRQTQIMAAPKAKEPMVWLKRRELDLLTWLEKVEGVAEPGQPGATREYPGVFHIIDQGIIEYGAQKPYSHEYFFSDGKLKGKMVFRMLEREKSEDGSLEDIEKTIEKAGYSMDEVYKILPPAEVQEAEPMTPFFWVAIQAKDQTPYVLTKEAENKEWLPSSGISALPKKIRKNVPEKLQYWKEKDKKKALAMRSELRQFEELDIEKKTVPFVLQHHFWKGQVVIRFGASVEHWDLRIDTGKPNLIHYVMEQNPLETEKIMGYLKPCKDKSTMDIPMKPVELKPGTDLNPTKDTPAWIETIDKGTCIIFDEKDDFKKIEFMGKKLKGLYVFKREDPKSAFWIIEPTELPEPKGKAMELQIEKGGKKMEWNELLRPFFGDEQEIAKFVERIGKVLAGGDLENLKEALKLLAGIKELSPEARRAISVLAQLAGYGYSYGYPAQKGENLEKAIEEIKKSNEELKKKIEELEKRKKPEKDVFGQTLEGKKE